MKKNFKTAAVNLLLGALGSAAAAFVSYIFSTPLEFGAASVAAGATAPYARVALDVLRGQA